MASKLYIVTYHYIKDFTNPLYKNLKGIDKQKFDEQLTFFEKNFNVVRMENVIDCICSNEVEKLPKNAMLLTFDDGYLCHYTAAYPILKKHNMQGSFFISANLLENKNKLLDANKIHLILANSSVEKYMKSSFPY